MKHHKPMKHDDDGDNDSRKRDVDNDAKRGKGTKRSGHKGCTGKPLKMPYR